MSEIESDGEKRRSCQQSNLKEIYCGGDRKQAVCFYHSLEETLIRADINLQNKVKAAITKLFWQRFLSTIGSLIDQWIRAKNRPFSVLRMTVLWHYIHSYHRTERFHPHCCTSLPLNLKGCIKYL